MKRTSSLCLLIIAVILNLTACQTAPEPRTAKLIDVEDGDYLITKTYSAADKLVEQLDKLDAEDGFIVSSFVDINSLDQSSSFGRISAERVASRLAQHGFKILDVKLRKEDILIQSAEGSNGNLVNSFFPET